MQHINELRLCEASRLVLRPNVLYRFTVDPGCTKCVAANEPYQEECERCKTPIYTAGELENKRCAECLRMSSDCCD